MSPYLVALLLVLISILQSTVVPTVLPGQVRPDLMLMVVVGWGIVHGNGQAILWGLGGGIFLDLLSGAPFGIHAVTLGAIGLLSDVLQTNFFRSNIFVPLASIFIATLLYHISQGAMMQSLGYPVNWSNYMFAVILPTTLLNTALMPFVFYFLRRIDRVVRPRLTW